MAFSTTLTADLGAADLIVSITDNTGARTVYPWRATIGSEVIYVTGGVEEGLDWTILRGSDDTDATEHLTGSVLTGTPVAATVFVDTVDPGAVGAKNLWLETPSGGLLWPRWHVRNATDDGWISAGVPSASEATNANIADPSGRATISLNAGAAYGDANNSIDFGSSDSGLKLRGDIALLHLGPGTGYAGVYSLRDAGNPDPSAGAGVAAPIATLAFRQNGGPSGTGEVWLKTGTADTAWEQVTTA